MSLFANDLNVRALVLPNCFLREPGCKHPQRKADNYNFVKTSKACSASQEQIKKAGEEDNNKTPTTRLHCFQVLSHYFILKHKQGCNLLHILFNSGILFSSYLIFTNWKTTFLREMFSLNNCYRKDRSY